MPSIFRRCKDCQVEFEITEGEQEFYAMKVDDQGKPYSAPKRCVPCRAKKKIRFEERDKALLLANQKDDNEQSG